MKYMVNRYFNNFIPGQILEEVKAEWVSSGLVLVVEEKETFMEKVDDSVEALDPEKPKRKRG
jgi:hypothetical protein